MHERSRDLQSLSHSPRIDSRLFVRAVDKLEPRQQLFRALFSNSLRNAEVFRVEQQVIAAGEAAVEIIHLRHYADSAFHFDRLASYVYAVDRCSAAGRQHASRKNSDCSRLAGAVRP